MPFPDIETAICDLLAASVGGDGHTGTTTPADLGERLPFVRCNRYAGADDRITDRPTVDVDWFAVGRNATRDLAVAGHDLLTLGWHKVGPVVIDQVETSVGPRFLPWGNSNIRRMSATYVVSARRAN